MTTLNDVTLIGRIIGIGDVKIYKERDYIRATLKIEKTHENNTYTDYITLSLRDDNVLKIQSFGLDAQVFVRGSLSCREYADSETGQMKRSSMEVSVFILEAIA
jgi:hypothetical protein